MTHPTVSPVGLTVGAKVSAAIVSAAIASGGAVRRHLNLTAGGTGGPASRAAAMGTTWD
ncbi:hypothetical protein GCM10022226_44980 [Sphaerisporangium flaviroseum]|uniref:Uncharacterized protein n=1 Tax=Sphaerisporangium flaviroseum TaxID=509199 RepID=A0ABP7IIY0_9ACTN